MTKTSKDAPLTEIADPYECEPKTCVLCPKRYLEEIRPSWRNPKLLAQFVSPHTGLVYGKHITGLCEFMQNEVVKEVRRAQKMGEYLDLQSKIHSYEVTKLRSIKILVTKAKMNKKIVIEFAFEWKLSAVK